HVIHNELIRPVQSSCIAVLRLRSLTPTARCRQTPILLQGNRLTFADLLPVYSRFVACLRGNGLLGSTPWPTVPPRGVANGSARCAHEPGVPSGGGTTARWRPRRCPRTAFSVRSAAKQRDESRRD